MDALIHIRMLGEFSISCGDRKLTTASAARIRQIWRLMEYLIANRKRLIPHDELAALLWPDGEAANPASALKNLVYRARRILEDQLATGARSWISLTSAGYGWSGASCFLVDAEEFECLTRKTFNASLPGGERLESALCALELYAGDFLPDAAGESWADPLMTYYHSAYLLAVEQACSLLEAMGRAEEILPLCERALTIDPLDEALNMRLVHEFMRQNRPSDAAKLFHRYATRLENDLCAQPSPAARAQYSHIMRTRALDESHDTPDSVTVCSYPLFNDLCQKVMQRAGCGSGRVACLALLTLLDARGAPPEAPQSLTAMERLRGVLLRSLRESDVFSEVSDHQFVALLVCRSYENGVAAVQRVHDTFTREFRGPLRLQFKVRAPDRAQEGFTVSSVFPECQF